MNQYNEYEDNAGMCWRIKGPTAVLQWYMSRENAVKAAADLNAAYAAGSIGARVDGAHSPDVVQAVCAAYSEHISEVRIKDVQSPSRLKHLVRARHLCAYIMREHEGLTLMEIAEVMDKHHATVLHSVTEAKDALRFDGRYRLALQSALRALGIESLPLAHRGTGIA